MIVVDAQGTSFMRIHRPAIFEKTLEHGIGQRVQLPAP